MLESSGSASMTRIPLLSGPVCDTVLAKEDKPGSLSLLSPLPPRHDKVEREGVTSGYLVLCSIEDDVDGSTSRRA